MNIAFRRDDAGVDQSTVGLKPALIVRPRKRICLLTGVSSTRKNYE